MLRIWRTKRTWRCGCYAGFGSPERERSILNDERRRASVSLDPRPESLRRESTSRADSHWPSIPALRGPWPAARVTAPRRELLPLWGQRAQRGGRIGRYGRKRGGPSMSARLALTLASLLACLAVALGAFGAHALKTRIAPDMQAAWQTAVLYHGWHAL